jgi:drug/metabolite transporter (DMT)-like permease
MCMLPVFGWQLVQGASWPAGLPAWSAIVFVAVFSSALAHALWVQGVAKIGANRAGAFIHLMPLFGAGLAMGFLGERLEPYHAGGAALVLTGVALTSWS